MSINDLLPSVASLSHADKFRLVHILLEQLAKEEGISTRQTPVQMEQMLIDHKTTMGRKPVNAKDISKAKNPDLRGSLAAMQRAAALARETAIQTNTNIVIEKDGKIGVDFSGRTAPPGIRSTRVYKSPAFRPGIVFHCRIPLSSYINRKQWTH